MSDERHTAEWMINVAELTPEAKAELQISTIEGMADAWSLEVDLLTMIKNATSPMKLNRSAPQEVRDAFHKRMIEQVDAIARQSFLEGACRAVDMVQEAYSGEISRLTARIAELEKANADLQQQNSSFAKAIVEGDEAFSGEAWDQLCREANAINPLPVARTTLEASERGGGE